MVISYFDLGNPINPLQHMLELQKFDNPFEPKYKADVPFVWGTGGGEHNLSYTGIGHNNKMVLMNLID